MGACHVEQSETSRISAAEERFKDNLEILRFAQNDNLGFQSAAGRIRRGEPELPGMASSLYRQFRGNITLR